MISTNQFVLKPRLVCEDVGQDVCLTMHYTYITLTRSSESSTIAFKQEKPGKKGKPMITSIITMDPVGHTHKA